MKAKPLSQVSIVTTPEAEEAVGQLLERLFGAIPSVYTDTEKQISAVTAFLEKSVAELRRQETSLAEGLRLIESCGLPTGPARVAMARVKREDWAESWKRHFKIIEVGRRLLIKPSWSKKRPRASQAVVVLDPGLSFGTGQHATTGYCLAKLAALAAPGRSMLDMGCGSGILSIAAAKLGCAPVAAFDFDPVAVRVAQANLRRNRVQPKVSCTRQDLTKLPRGSRRKYNLICANLMAPLLIAEADRIIARLAPGGTLILAGILATEFEAVRAAYEQHGLQLLDRKAEREWESGLFLKPSMQRGGET